MTSLPARPHHPLPRSGTALHGLLVALPVSATFWCALILIVELLR